MTEMIDRVARAMWEAEPTIYAWGPDERRTVTWDEAVSRNLAGVEIFRGLAKAAIAAMKGPTAAMFDVMPPTWNQTQTAVVYNRMRH